jgi:UDP-glucose 4-epimerase
MKKIKVVVTGGAGFIGGHLTKKLVEMNFEVHVVDNLSKGKKENVPKEATLHVTDVRNSAELKKIFKNAEYVFHLAANPSVEYSIHHPEETRDINENGTHNVLSAFKQSGAKKLIYASSSSVYGDQKTKKFSEDLKPNPKSPYALQKYIGEQHLALWSKLYGIDTLSLRFFNVYGPGQAESGAYAFIIAKFIKNKRENKPLPITGDGKQSRDFVHVSDVVDACIKAMTSKTKPGDVINIGGGKNYSVNEIAKIIGGKTVKIAPRIEPKHTLADNSKANKILKWSPKISLVSGISGLI